MRFPFFQKKLDVQPSVQRVAGAPSQGALPQRPEGPSRVEQVETRAPTPAPATPALQPAAVSPESKPVPASLERRFVQTGFGKMDVSSELGSQGALELDCYNALSLLGVTGYYVKARYKHYSALRANARIDDPTKTVEFYFSDGYLAAPDDARIGLALYLANKLFYRRHIPPAASVYLDAYKRFSKSASSANLDHSLSRLHGNDTPILPKGTHYDLQAILEDVFVRYQGVFAGVPRPRITWSREASRQRLGFHDPGKNRIVISKLLDHPRVPLFVVESVVFHELLHEKHHVQYERGHSLRRTVHPKAFKEDEKKFKDYFLAEEWIERELKHVR